MKKLINILTLAMISTGIFVACNVSNNDSDNNSFRDGIINDVWDFISEEDLALIENTLDVPIHRGENPPDIDDIFGVSSGESITFLMKPFLLVNTTVPNDQDFDLPRPFNDLYVKLSNQSLDDYTIDMAFTHPNDPPLLGTSGFIVGENNRFTIFGPLVQQISGHQIRIIYVLSGQIGNNVLTNLNMGILMVDNDGEPGHIPNGTGRRFIDQQGTSAQAGWPHSTIMLVPTDDLEVFRKNDVSNWIYGLLPTENEL